MKDSVKEPNKFHNYETEKITHKASNAAEYIELIGSSTRDRHARMHDALVLMLFSEHPPIFVHDELGWKNRTTRCNRFWRASCSRLEYVDIRSVY